MTTLLVRLDPQRLDNPDADLRYLLTDLLVERSAGVIGDDGYDYAGEGPFLILFLKVTELEPALACIFDVVENVRVLGNDLRPAVVIAVEREGEHQVVYPLGFKSPFLPR